jgi:hypothetical protein
MIHFELSTLFFSQIGISQKPWSSEILVDNMSVN